MLEHILFRVVLLPILFWTAIGGFVALAVKAVLRRPTMPVWPILPFVAWGVCRALIRAWHAFS